MCHCFDEFISRIFSYAYMLETLSCVSTLLSCWKKPPFTKEAEFTQCLFSQIPLQQGHMSQPCEMPVSLKRWFRACKGGGYSGMTMSMSCAQQRRRLMVSYDECNSNVQYSLVTSMPYSKWSQKTSWLNHSFLPEKQEEIPSRMFDE